VQWKSALEVRNEKRCARLTLDLFFQVGQTQHVKHLAIQLLEESHIREFLFVNVLLLLLRQVLLRNVPEFLDFSWLRKLLKDMAKDFVYRLVVLFGEDVHNGNKDLKLRVLLATRLSGEEVGP